MSTTREDDMTHNPFAVERLEGAHRALCLALGRPTREPGSLPDLDALAVEVKDLAWEVMRQERDRADAQPPDRDLLGRIRAAAQVALENGSHTAAAKLLELEARFDPRVHF